MDEYLNILREWQENTAKPFLYEHIAEVFPAYQFRRVSPGVPSKDHWASRYKLDLSIPKIKHAEKTVIYRSDMRFREQGKWNEPVGIMDLYMKVTGECEIYRAYQKLSADFMLGMPEKNSPEVVERAARRMRRASVLDDLVSYFAWNLENNRSSKAAEVRRYLLHRRGFTKEQISRLNLGFVPEWGTVMRYIVSQKGHKLEDLTAVCEVRNADGKTSVGRVYTLAIPYECGGVLKGFLFRRVGEGSGPKYMASQDLDRKSVFFNITADSDSKEIIVVEGEFDALKASAEGVENVVAIGGSELAGERRRQIEDAILRRGVRKITLCLDLDAESDDPSRAKTGERFEHVMRSVHTIRDVDMSFEDIYVATFPSPSDPDEFIRNNGVEAFLELIDKAKPYWRYLFDYKSNE